MNLSFDCIVMLTSSDWFSELRSNRYHYAVRFAQHCPVIFVQPDKKGKGYEIESTEVPQVWVLHVSNCFDKNQIKVIESILTQKQLQQPIFWVYNANFAGYLYQRVSQNKKQLIIFHATEDYFSPDSPIRYKLGMGLYSRLLVCLKMTDLLIAVSLGVEQSYRTLGHYQGKSLLVTNGCDDLFYAQGHTEKQSERIAFYQGNIFNKLDYDLLIYLAKNLTQWIFIFCGPVLFNEPKWQALLTYSNVKYIGVLSPETLRQQTYRATVGLIPFQQEAWLVKKSFPLKAFEYLACGLPVVSITIDSLKEFSDVFFFADTFEDFQQAILDAENQRWDKHAILQRQKSAKNQSYDRKFAMVYLQLVEMWRQLSVQSDKQLHLKWRIFLNWIVLTASLRNVIKSIYKGVVCVWHSRCFYSRRSSKTIRENTTNHDQNHCASRSRCSSSDYS